MHSEHLSLPIHSAFEISKYPLELWCPTGLLDHHHDYPFTMAVHITIHLLLSSTACNQEACQHAPQLSIPAIASSLPALIHTTSPSPYHKRQFVVPSVWQPGQVLLLAYRHFILPIPYEECKCLTVEKSHVTCQCAPLLVISSTTTYLR